MDGLAGVGGLVVVGAGGELDLAGDGPAAGHGPLLLLHLHVVCKKQTLLKIMGKITPNGRRDHTQSTWEDWNILNSLPPPAVLFDEI